MGISRNTRTGNCRIRVSSWKLCRDQRSVQKMHDERILRRSCWCTSREFGIWSFIHSVTRVCHQKIQKIMPQTFWLNLRIESECILLFAVISHEGNSNGFSKKYVNHWRQCAGKEWTQESKVTEGLHHRMVLLSVLCDTLGLIYLEILKPKSNDEKDLLRAA